MEPRVHRSRRPSESIRGKRYDLTIRNGLKGSLQYEHIDARRVVVRWSTVGFRESATWSLEPNGEMTRVVHEFDHEGGLALLLRRAFRTVAQQRNERLARRAEIGLRQIPDVRVIPSLSGTYREHRRTPMADVRPGGGCDSADPDSHGQPAGQGRCRASRVPWPAKPTDHRCADAEHSSRRGHRRPRALDPTAGKRSR